MAAAVVHDESSIGPDVTSDAVRAFVLEQLTQHHSVDSANVLRILADGENGRQAFLTNACRNVTHRYQESAVFACLNAHLTPPVQAAGMEAEEQEQVEYEKPFVQVMDLCTGLGKTRPLLALAAVFALRDARSDAGGVADAAAAAPPPGRKRRVLFISPRKNIRDQYKDTWGKFNELLGTKDGDIVHLVAGSAPGQHEVSSITDDVYKKAKIVVCNFQTLARETKLQQAESRSPGYATSDFGFDTFVIDEVHHEPAASYQILFEFFKPSRAFGASGTVRRPDGAAINDGEGADDVPFRRTLAWAEKNQLVKRTTVRQVMLNSITYETQQEGEAPNQVTLDGERLRRLEDDDGDNDAGDVGDNNDGDEGAIDPQMEAIEWSEYCILPVAKELVQSVADFRQHTGTLKTGLAIARNKDHAWRIYTRMLKMRDPYNNGRHIKVGIVAHECGDQWNRQTFDKLERGELHILVAVAMVTEGYDWPPFCSIAFFYRVGSFLVLQQMFGRILRYIRYGDDKYVVKERNAAGALEPVDPPRSVLGSNVSSQEDLDQNDQMGRVIFLKIFKLGKKFREIGMAVEDQTLDVLQLPRASASNNASRGANNNNGSGDQPPPTKKPKTMLVHAQTGASDEVQRGGEALAHPIAGGDASTVVYDANFVGNDDEVPPWRRQNESAGGGGANFGQMANQMNQMMQMMQQIASQQQAAAPAPAPH